LFRIDYFGEGETDTTVARRLIEHVRAEPGRNWLDRRAPRGKQALDRRLPGFAVAATHGGRILILRDFDSEAGCVGELVARLLPCRPTMLLLRIAVRAVEAWMMADRKGLADALRVTESTIPHEPEKLVQPKVAMLLLGRASRSRAVRDVFHGSWQEQAGWLIEFAEEHWSVARACASGAAPSLTRAVDRVATLARVPSPQ
jgi:hypothetical protein